MNTVNMMQEKVLLEKTKSKTSQLLADINWGNVLAGSFTSIGTLTFGLYTYIFASIGGVGWFFVLPYGIITGFCAWATYYCFANMMKSSGVSAWAF